VEKEQVGRQLRRRRKAAVVRVTTATPIRQESGPRSSTWEVYTMSMACDSGIERAMLSLGSQVLSCPVSMQPNPDAPSDSCKLFPLHKRLQHVKGV
jgi:hypothetical protein